MGTRVEKIRSVRLFWGRLFGGPCFFFSFARKSHETVRNLLLALWWLPFSMCAQVFDAGRPQLTWSDFVEEYLTMLDDESEEANVLTLRGYTVLDEIEPFLENPLNLNTATAEDFRALGLLDEAQIDSLLRYRSRLRAFASPGELMGVRGLDYRRRRWLSLFTYVGDTLVASPNWRKRCFSGRHSLETRAELPLYRRKGFRPSDREELLRKRSQFFLGPNLGTALRYRYSARRELQWGLSFENDVGEPFAAHGNRPFDHVGGFVTYRAHSGRWSGLVGDYALAIGEGLLFGHAFFVHPLLELERTAARQSRFLPNSPSNETQFLRGAVVSGGRGAWRYTGFASHALWDARLRGDSALTLYHAGLHRSLDERTHRHTLGVTTIGARAEWISGRFTAGATTYFAGFSPPVFPSERTYAAGYLRGNHAAGVALDGGYAGAGREVRGEVAVDGSGNISAVAFARFHRRDDWQSVVSARVLAPGYVAPYARVGQDGNRAQNETGVSLALRYAGLRNSVLRGFIDAFRHPRPTFRAAAPAVGLAGGVEWEHHRGAWSRLLRYRVKTKQQTIAGFAPRLEFCTTHRFRARCGHEHARWSWNASFDATAFHCQTRPHPRWGLMLSYRSKVAISSTLQASMFGAVFSAPDFSARLFAYEPQLRGRGAFPSFYGRGCAGVLLVQWKPSLHWTCECRYAAIYRSDRATVGSGMQRIDGHSQQDLSFQLRYVF